MNDDRCDNYGIEWPCGFVGVRQVDFSSAKSNRIRQCDNETNPRNEFEGAKSSEIDIWWRNRIGRKQTVVPPSGQPRAVPMYAEEQIVWHNPGIEMVFPRNAIDGEQAGWICFGTGKRNPGI